MDSLLFPSQRRAAESKPRERSMSLTQDQIRELRSITDRDDVRNYHLNRIANALEDIIQQLRVGGSNPLSK